MKLKNLLLLATIAVFAIVSLVTILTLPEQRLESDVFKLSFAFGIVVNLFIVLGSILFVFRKNKNTLARIPVALFPVPVISVVMLVTGLIFMCSSAERISGPVIAFAVELILYSAVRVVLLAGAKYIERSEKAVDKKTFFIGSLEADVRDCIAKAKHQESISALRALAENVRFSDPMSDKSLGKTESRISSIVDRIYKKLSSKPETDVTELVKEADDLIASRNNRCKLLK